MASDRYYKENKTADYLSCPSKTRGVIFMNDKNKLNSFVLVVEDRGLERAKIGQALEMLKLKWKYAISVEEAINYIENKDVIMVVLDLYLRPTHDPRATLDFMLDFRKNRPEVPIIILSVHDPRPEELRDVISARVGYFYRKPDEDFDISELVNLFQLALGGTVSYSPEIANSIPSLIEHAFQHDDPLTPREWSILILICQDLPTEVIAQRLVIKAAAVRSHKANILDKLESKRLIQF